MAACQPPVNSISPTIPKSSSPEIITIEPTPTSEKTTTVPINPDWNKDSRVLTETTVGETKAAEKIEIDNTVTALGQAFSIESIDEKTSLVDPLEEIAMQVELRSYEKALQSIFALESTVNEDQRVTLLDLKAKVFRALDMDIAALRVEAELVLYLDESKRNIAIQGILNQIKQLDSQIRLDLSKGSDSLAAFALADQILKDPTNESLTNFIRKFRRHPIVQSTLKGLEFITASEPDVAFQITALLPLSGDLANAGRAIRDGLLFAIHHGKHNKKLKLRILDSEALSNADLAIIASGKETEFVIGPLKRENIDRFLATNPQIPVLVLNRMLAESINLPPHVYSLSLAIEDDARSAFIQAKRLMEKPQILSMHADQDLGRRVALELDFAASQFDGKIVGHFPIHDKKPQNTVSKALGVSDSKMRHQALSKLLQLKLKYTPRIRQDMTAIVLQTNIKQARQLRPLLDFYYADATPVFFIGAYREDLADVSEDFKNSHILSTPWEIGNDESVALKARPLAAGVLGPLTGIGIDALSVTAHLGFGEPVEFMGQSGFLRLEPNGVIQRQLSLVTVELNESITTNLWVPSTSTNEASGILDVR